MQVEQLTKLLLSDEEMAALYEVCAVSLENNLLNEMPLAFALAIVETFKDYDDEGDMTVDELPEDENITIQ